ncbi:DNA-binding protein [Mangrovimicrobium sediminis]|uniref:DNA-binding protein n=1 Tax=Mangrovimicrobium sediminis TaxID=2562682 RepID=A0A4Z0LVF9_9GAMM|nr:OB-fold domain-containing protein [Haliea sp. SAOS-164]TGD71260.1 DNA-binding protein [Haliea sp. SAOS-164]
MSKPQRLLPRPTPETQHFWDGCREGELRLQRCRDCAEPFFPPRPFCPHCGKRDVEVFRASGRATLYSYVINYRPRPDMGEEPYAIAVVTLEEGPRLMTNIVSCPQTPEALQLDMPLQVHFAAQNETITLPLFEPAQPAPGDTP